MKRQTLTFALILGCAAAVWAASPSPLASLRDIHALTNAEANRTLPVAFEATVTYFRKYEKTLFVQDGGVGIYVAATTDQNLVPGDRLLIRGITHASFSPSVESADITVLRHGSPPAPIPAAFEPLIQAKLDCMYITARGVVRSAEMTLSSGRHVTQFELLMEGGPAGVIMDNDDPSKLNGLLDAEVEITGVASGRFDGKMQQVGILIHSTSFNDVKILRPPSVDAWSIPITQMDKVLTGYNVREFTGRVRVQGTLTYYQPLSMAILQDGARSIRVLTPRIDPLRVGDHAEAIGIPFVDNGFLTLKLGQIRNTGAAAPIVPAPVSWDELASGKHSFDLVSIEGTVVTQVREAAQDVYIISAGDHLLSAAVRHPFVYEFGASREPPPMPSIAPGSKVRVTGVAILDDGNPFNGAVAFGILLRSASDVTVIASPPLLNVRNLVLLVGLLLLVVFFVGGRGWAVERRMRHQNAVLAYVERRRGRILEDINGSRPLAEIIEQITELVSLKLHGAPCWCQVADGAQLGNRPERLEAMRIVQRDVPARSGPPLGTLSAAFDPKAKPSPDELEALSMAAGLATLAIETRRLYSDLLRRSEFDLLTGIHNRFSFEKHLDDLIERARLEAGIFGLIYIDLDRFKQINDVYGHKIGDLYLQEVTQRMKGQLRSIDKLGRFGGDEFAALVPVVRGRADVEEIAVRLERCFDEPFEVDGQRLNGSASVGIALYPEDGNSKDNLLSCADDAMYAVKNAKRPDERVRG